MPLLKIALVIILSAAAAAAAAAGNAARSQSQASGGSNPMRMGRRMLGAAAMGEAETARIGSSCTSKDITISQGRDSSSSSGIPQYVVQIVNTCLNNCTPSDIHVYCGWFASAPLVNPSAFRRLQFNDCLVNDGRPLRHGEIVRFQYANSFMYPLRFKSAKFCS